MLARIDYLITMIDIVPTTKGDVLCVKHDVLAQTNNVSPDRLC